MKAHRKQRLYLIILLVLVVGGAAALLLNALNENMMFFFTPTQVAAQEIPKDRNFRLGGMVVTGSFRREGDGLTSHFRLTDTAQEVPVTYTGILPDLFREGQGIVAMGRMGPQGVFVAEEVLAKHDENYMPPEVADAMKAAQAAKAASPGALQEAAR